MKKLAILTFLLSLFLSAGAAGTLQEKYGSFSVIGDSYSTFMGFTDPLPNAQWYPHAGNAMASVEQTWWKMFERESGVKLEQNNSFSGSTICTHSWNNTTDLVNSFVGRVDNLRKAGLIIVEGATNDNNAGSTLGNYVWSGFTDADKRTFRGGTAYVIDFLQKKYPDSQIVFMLNSDLRADINESVQTVCDHYGVPVLKLHDITKIEEHPDTPGMLAIKEQLMEMLCEMNGMTYISEDSDVNVPEAKAGVDVMVNKAMHAGEWNSLCLPFALSARRIQELFGESTVVQTYASFADGNVVLKCVESIEANMPYLVMPANDMLEPFIVENVDLEPTNPVIVGDECVMKGIYSSVVAHVGREYNYALASNGKVYTHSDNTVVFPALSVILKPKKVTDLTATLEGYTTPVLPELAFGDAFSPVHAGKRLSPAIPVIVADPFLSVWSHESVLNEGTTKHLTGADNALEGYVEVDGELYRFLGKESAEVVKGIKGSAVATTPAVQTACTLTATQTFCDFTAGNVALSVVFTSPLLVTDAASLDAAVNYISYKVTSLDGKPHEVKFHLALSADLIRRSTGDGVKLGTDDTAGVTFGKVGRSVQSMTEGSRGNWGYLLVMADADRGQKMAKTTKNLIFTDDMGSTSSAADYTLVGRDENNMAIGFGYARFPAPWTLRYGSFNKLMMDYAEGVNERLKACREFDAKIYNDALASGGEDYADLCMSVYRQVIAGCKRALSDTGDILLYNIDAGSTWRISQADQLLAAAPLFLAYNPQLAYDLFEGVPNYIEMYPGFSSPYGNAPHHLGAWPIMAGAHLDMGVDSTTDLCILAGAAVKCGMDPLAISDYSYEYLTSLCRYLDLFTLPQYVGNFPNEGSADGAINNSANLRLKSVLAMALVAYIAEARGNAADAAFYQEMAGRWEEIFRTTYNAGDHYRHGSTVEWGQKYPLYYDKAFDLDIFPDVAATELAYYATQPMAEYGLQLDSRSTSTAKVSATMLTASIADDFGYYFDPIVKYLSNDLVVSPVGNQYNCLKGGASGSKGSVALGSVWAKVLIDRLGNGSGIDDVMADDTALGARMTGTYDLQGRRVTGVPAPGLYIVNGKKTVVR